MRGCIKDLNDNLDDDLDLEKRGRRYVSPRVRVVKLKACMICGCSGNPNNHDETVEFRFGVGVDGEWDGKEEIVLE